MEIYGSNKFSTKVAQKYGTKCKEYVLYIIE